MQTFTLLGLLLALASSIAFYLSSDNQRWLAAPWRARPARLLGALLLLAGWLALTQALRLLTAVFLLTTILMLALALLPYLGALFSQWRNKS